MTFDKNTQYVYVARFFDGVRNDIEKMKGMPDFTDISVIAAKYHAVLYSNELIEEMLLFFGICKTVCLKVLMEEMVSAYEMFEKFSRDKKIESLGSYPDFCDAFLRYLTAMTAIETVKM